VQNDVRSVFVALGIVNRLFRDVERVREMGPAAPPRLDAVKRGDGLDAALLQRDMKCNYISIPACFKG
jgi:hypothetical protein